jgi:hypothetical protein
MSDKQWQHIDDDLMTDAVLRLLPPKQLEHVFDHLDECAECETRFRMAVSRFETLQAKAAGAAAAGVTKHKRSSDMSWWRVIVRPVLSRPAFATAAVLLILVLVVMIPLQRRQDPGTVAWIPVAGEILEKRSANGGADDRFWTGLEAYRRHRADEAIDNLTAAKATGPYRDLRNIYLASALANSSRFDEAMELINGVVVDDLPQPWREEVRWVRAVALIGTGDTESGLATIELLAGVDGRVGDRARSYLKSRR